MNSRDITENPHLKKGYLESIYTMQKDLLEHYIGIEGLPLYPVDVNTKESQILLKDFTSRIIEELAEGFEAQLKVINSTFNNAYWQSSNFKEEAYKSMLDDLQNIGEEQSDAMHFFMELLIYANIQLEDIESYIKTYFKDIKFAFIEDDNLHKFQQYGLYLLIDKYPQLQNIEDKNTIDVLNTPYLKDDKRYFNCGSKVNINMLPYYKMMLWDITYHLNISRNYLKNKPWKQSEVMTQEVAYQSELVNSFLLFLGYLYYMGCNAEQIYFLYFKKNKVNKFRIQSKY